MMDDKGIKLAEEIIEIMKDGNMENSIENYPLFKDTVCNNPYSEQLLNNLCDAEKIKKSIEACGDKSQSFNRLKRKQKKLRQRRVILKVTSVAAAFILSCGIYYQTMQETDIVVENNQIEKIDQPIIMLESGERIDLKNSGVHSRKYIVNNGNSLTYNNIDASQIDSTEYNTLIIPSKFTFSITLSDGTIVHLNANSKLKYPVCFTGEMREVNLDGEAYFKVAKSSTPFIVKTDGMDIKVYGTEFNINASKANSIEAILVEGSIGATVNSEEIMMTPNQMLKYNTLTSSIELSKINADDFMSWRIGYFSYELTPIADILDEVSAWYGVTFACQREELKNRKISIMINRTRSINEFIKAIEDITECKFTKEGGETYKVN